MHEQGVEVLRAAGVALERRQKIEAAIRDEVTNLTALIGNRLQSDREFRRLECARAIGEDSAEIPGAKKAADVARAAVEQASLKLGGLRMNLGEQGTDFVALYDRLAGEIPKQNERIVAEFSSEWESACAQFSIVLGRRRAIEALLGYPLALSEPAPIAVEIGEAGALQTNLAAVAAALKRIGAAQRASERPLNPGIFFDPTAVYKLTSDRSAGKGLPKGTFVTDACFEPGGLALLLEIQECRCVLPRDLGSGVGAAAVKSAAIDKAARDRERAEDERRLRSAGDENLKKSGKVVEPAWADGGRAATKAAQIAARSMGPSDSEAGAV